MTYCLRALVCAVFSIISLVPASFVFASAASAKPYLEAHAQSPWVVMALSAVGEAPDTSFLQSVAGTAAIDLEAPMLAMTAAHQDPRTYPGSDFVQDLKAHYTGGPIGDPATINDDLFGVLALISAGVSAQDDVVAGTRAFIEAHQNTDGGWSFMTSGTSDTNSTAAAIMALIASGSSPGDAHLTQALEYLHAAQNQDGGFPYDPKSQWGTASDASSDSWVMMALSASGVSESSWATASGTPMSNLLSHQTPDGYFEFQLGSGEDSFTPVTTSYAVLALSGKTLPVAILPPPPPPPPPPASQPAAPTSAGGGGMISFHPQADPAAVTNVGLVLGTSTVGLASSTPPVVATTTAAESTSYLFTYNLKYGMHDSAVVELQKKLIAHGALAIVAPTGWFGPRTLMAVKSFQKENEIPTTGFVGPMTRASLNAWK